MAQRAVKRTRPDRKRQADVAHHQARVGVTLQSRVRAHIGDQQRGRLHRKFAEAVFERNFGELQARATFLVDKPQAPQVGLAQAVNSGVAVWHPRV